MVVSRWGKKQRRPFYHAIRTRRWPCTPRRHDPGIMGAPAQRAAHSPAEEIHMHWLWVFVIGLVVGLVAKLLMPGKDPGGFIITAILGIAGSRQLGRPSCRESVCQYV